MKGITCFCALWFVISGYTASAQNDTAFLTKATDALGRLPAAERVYLHLDRQNYGFGDTVWYKAYTVIGPRHQLSALSGVLYVELISPKDSLVTRQIIPMVSGAGWGGLPLLHSLKPGSYRIRTYTNWMRNFGAGSFYDQRISLGGAVPLKANTADSKPDVQFFPEGGSLVAGVRSRVAFKAVGASGLGEPITGTVVDDEGHTVAEIVTQHAGMGQFAFTPQLNKTYVANVITSTGVRFSLPLPKPLPAGYVLTVNNSQPDSIYLNIGINNQAMAAQSAQAFYIVAQSNGKAYYTTEGKPGQMNYTASVAKSRFPSGIAQFTLFSYDEQPVAERIVYIEGQDTLQLKAAGLPGSSGTRQPVTISLQAADGFGKPVTGSFSVAVINESSAAGDENSEGTLLNNLLLTSHLKGYVEKPNYYFINKSDQTHADLDLLMLTQGYRRFEWKAILNNTALKAIAYQPQPSLELAGIIKTAGGKAAPGAKVSLVYLKQNLFRDTIADEDGNFRFNGLPVTDTATLVLRARQKNNSSNVSITVSPITYPGITSTINNEYLLPDTSATVKKTHQDYLQQQKTYFSSKGVQLKQVEIKSQKINKPDLTRSSNLHGGGNADQVIMGDQLGSCADLADCLTGKAFFISFTGGAATNIRNGRKMSVIVDGIVLGHDRLNDIVVGDVYSVEVLRTNFARSIYGSSIESGGALVITMKQGGEKQEINAAISGIATTPFFGYTKTRVFYTPKYTPKNTAGLNLGSTIYWKPNIITGADGKATFEYFNNDTKGIYRMVIEGIDDDGNLGRAVYRYNVQ